IPDPLAGRPAGRPYGEILDVATALWLNTPRSPFVAKAGAVGVGATGRSPLRRDPGLGHSDVLEQARAGQLPGPCWYDTVAEITPRPVRPRGWAAAGSACLRPAGPGPRCRWGDRPR